MTTQANFIQDAIKNGYENFLSSYSSIPDKNGNYGNPNAQYAYSFTTPYGRMTFYPESFVNKGINVGDKTYYNAWFLNEKNLNNFALNSTYVDLSKVDDKGRGYATKGYILPEGSAPQGTPNADALYSQNTSDIGGITGLSKTGNGNYVYAVERSQGKPGGYIQAAAPKAQITGYDYVDTGFGTVSVPKYANVGPVTSELYNPAARPESNNLLDKIMANAGPIVKLAALVTENPGLYAASASLDIAQGNYLGAAVSVAGMYSNAPGVDAETAASAKNIYNGLQVANAIKTNNPIAALTALSGMSGTGLPPEFTKATQLIAINNAIQKKDLSALAVAVGNIADNKDLAYAGKAANVLQAINTGDLSKITASLYGFIPELKEGYKKGDVTAIFDKMGYKLGENETKLLDGALSSSPETLVKPLNDKAAVQSGWDDYEQLIDAMQLGITNKSDYLAVKEGWSNADQKEEAAKQGIQSSDVWKQKLYADQKAQYEKEYQAKLETEAKNSGWTNLEQKHDADLLGYKTPAEYKEYESTFGKGFNGDVAAMKEADKYGLSSQDYYKQSDAADKAGYPDFASYNKAKDIWGGSDLFKATGQIPDYGVYKQYVADDSARKENWTDAKEKSDALAVGAKTPAEFKPYKDETQAKKEGWTDAAQKIEAAKVGINSPVQYGTYQYEKNIAQKKYGLTDDEYKVFRDFQYNKGALFGYNQTTMVDAAKDQVAKDQGWGSFSQKQTASQYYGITDPDKYNVLLNKQAEENKLSTIKQYGLSASEYDQYKKIYDTKILAYNFDTDRIAKEAKDQTAVLEGWDNYQQKADAKKANILDPKEYDLYQETQNKIANIGSDTGAPTTSPLPVPNLTIAPSAGVQVAGPLPEDVFKADVGGFPIYGGTSRADTVKPPFGYDLVPIDQADDKPEGAYYDPTQNAWFMPNEDAKNLQKQLQGEEETGAETDTGTQGEKDITPSDVFYYDDGSYKVTNKDGTSTVFNADGTIHTETGTTGGETDTGLPGFDAGSLGGESDLAPTDQGGSLGDESDLPPTGDKGSLGDESDMPPEEEPQCAPGYHWNGSVCVSDTDVEDRSTTCPEGYLFDFDTQTCVLIGTTPGGGTKPGGIPGGTPKTPTGTPTDTTKPPGTTVAPPPTKTSGLNANTLATLLALDEQPQQQQQMQPTPLADIKYYYDFGDMLPQKPQNTQGQPAQFEFFDGGEVQDFSVDDLIQMLKGD